ncbi:hypothetical protein E4U19_006775 [Claviceps sp. Clav32 group G5]|nr:hypothetical protein E4U19_006775 [Claviceps sp. Clav32 group G5]KAG6033451.1 hypothetical protein E4U40_005310 [Claviceps sp. LM458 group G5]KAG6050401.1 hypothetical protein E4U39_004222 [Claviceps sp. Clav50 group G5]
MPPTHEMSKEAPANIQSTQVKGGKDTSSGDFAARSQHEAVVDQSGRRRRRTAQLKPKKS